MKLARMQDIGGLRAVVGSINKVREIEHSYRSSERLKHELASSKDYIQFPKEDGYRSVHLIYRYRNDRAADYNGLSLELQLRTRLQHAWATAVETMGTFLGQALKSGQGEKQWRGFFTTASAALALVEKSPPVPGYEGRDSANVIEEVARTEKRLHVLEKLRGFAVAADRITAERGKGAFHLVILDSAKRSVRILPYPVSRLEAANEAYAAIERLTKAGEPIEAVLVSAGPIDALRKAYPNYFLDTQEFARQIEKLISSIEGRKPDGSNRPRVRTRASNRV